jgi:hypothetical protein
VRELRVDLPGGDVDDDQPPEETARRDRPGVVRLYRFALVLLEGRDPVVQTVDLGAEPRLTC